MVMIRGRRPVMRATASARSRSCWLTESSAGSLTGGLAVAGVLGGDGGDVYGALTEFSRSVASFFEEFHSIKGPTEGGSYSRTAVGGGGSLGRGGTTTAPTFSGKGAQALASSVKVSRQAAAFSGKAGAFGIGTGGILFQSGDLVDTGLQQAQHRFGLVGQGGRRIGAQLGDDRLVLGAVVGMDQGAGNGRRPGDGQGQPGPGQAGHRQTDGGGDAGDHNQASIIAV